MNRYLCPVDDCSEGFDEPARLLSHVAGMAEYDEDHKQQRDSPRHHLEWYAENCVDEDQSTLF